MPRIWNCTAFETRTLFSLVFKWCAHFYINYDTQCTCAAVVAKKYCKWKTNYYVLSQQREEIKMSKNAIEWMSICNCRKISSKVRWLIIFFLCSIENIHFFLLFWIQARITSIGLISKLLLIYAQPYCWKKCVRWRIRS